MGEEESPAETDEEWIGIMPGEEKKSQKSRKFPKHLFMFDSVTWDETLTDRLEILQKSCSRHEMRMRRGEKEAMIMKHHTSGITRRKDVLCVSRQEERESKITTDWMMYCDSIHDYRQTFWICYSCLSFYHQTHRSPPAIPNRLVTPGVNFKWS